MSDILLEEGAILSSVQFNIANYPAWFVIGHTIKPTNYKWSSASVFECRPPLLCLLMSRSVKMLVAWKNRREHLPATRGFIIRDLHGPVGFFVFLPAFSDF